MEEITLILLGVGYLIYKVAFKVPKDIKKLDEKIDMLNLHLKEIEIKLSQLDEKIDKSIIH